MLPAVLYLVRCLELALLLLCKLDCPNVVQTKHSVVFIIVACCALPGALPGTCTVVAVQTGLSKRRSDEALGGFYSVTSVLCGEMRVRAHAHTHTYTHTYTHRERMQVRAGF